MFYGGVALGGCSIFMVQLAGFHARHALFTFRETAPVLYTKDELPVGSITYFISVNTDAEKQVRSNVNP